jgi:hypothetical protein
VSFHALQVLLFHLLYFFFSMLDMGGVFAAVAVLALHQPPIQHASPRIRLLFRAHMVGDDGLVGSYADGGYRVRN